MGGQTKQTQNSTQQTSQLQNFLNNQTQAQTQTRAPWDATTGQLQSLLAQAGMIPTSLTPAESGALDTLTATGQAGNRFAPAIGGVADTLLAGGGPDRTGMATDTLNEYRNYLTPFARGDYVNPASNPALQSYLDVARNDAAENIRGRFAAGGRDFSGYENQTLGRGITQAEAPILADAYNRANADRLAAISGLYGAGNTTTNLLSGLDQTRLANMQAGVGVAGAANDANLWGPMTVLNAEAQRRGIPVSALMTQLGIVAPLASTFGTTTGTGTGTNTGTTTGFGNTLGTSETETSVPLWQQLVGGGIGLAGLAGGFGGPNLLGKISGIGSLFGAK